MRFNKLDLNLLVALDLLMTLKSVSRAADKMNLSQSAMSNALSRLREYFDDQLLVSVGRNMELTPRAQAMQHEIRDIIVRIESTLSNDAEFDPVRSDREFKIIMSDYSLIVLMPHVLALAAERNAAVRFQLDAQIEKPYTAIERGKADLMITPEALISENHPYENLFEDNFVCVAWREGAFGHRALDLKSYLGARHIRMVPANSNYSFDQDILEKAGVDRRVDVRCYNFASLPHLVVGSDRLATVQGLLAETISQSLPVTLHPMPMPFAPIKQCVQWHEYKSRDPALRWLRQILHEAASRLRPVGVPTISGSGIGTRVRPE